ncbi:MAG TPA: hypothetical protein VKK79_12000 [Candidatus Lokiarchaeia archaeon]|nr:hypothetical protein [Candidatus Lokiarchaeia archaeon]
MTRWTAEEVFASLEEIQNWQILKTQVHTLEQLEVKVEEAVQLSWQAQQAKHYALAKRIDASNDVVIEKIRNLKNHIRDLTKTL